MWGLLLLFIFRDNSVNVSGFLYFWSLRTLTTILVAKAPKNLSCVTKRSHWSQLIFSESDYKRRNKSFCYCFFPVVRAVIQISEHLFLLTIKSNSHNLLRNVSKMCYLMRQTLICRPESWSIWSSNRHFSLFCDLF